MRKLNQHCTSQEGFVQPTLQIGGCLLLLVGLILMIAGAASYNMPTSIVGGAILCISSTVTIIGISRRTHHHALRNLQRQDIEVGAALEETKGLSLEKKILKVNTIKDSLFGTNVKECIFIHSYLEKNNHKALITSDLLQQKAFNAQSALVLNTPEDWSQFTLFYKKGAFTIENFLGVYKELNAILKHASKLNTLSSKEDKEDTVDRIKAIRKEAKKWLQTEIYQLSTPPSLLDQCCAVVANTSRNNDYTSNLEEAKKHHILPVEILTKAENYQKITQEIMIKNLNTQRNEIKKWAKKLPLSIEVPFLEKYNHPAPTVALLR